MRSFPRGEKSFRQFLQEIKQNTLEAFENQEYPFDQLVKQVVINRDLSRNPLFDVMFSFRKPETSRTGKPDVDVSGLKQRIYNYQHTTAKFDLMLSSAELPGELVFSFEYCTKLFKRKKIDIFVILFKEIVSSVLENSQIKLGAIEISLPLLVEKKEEVTLDALDF
jgi:non-ribosomal peptide synthetase component F